MGAHDLVRRAWERANQRLLGAQMPYVGLAYDALEHFFPDDKLREWGLRRTKPV
jgi:hypothetical protein